MTLADASADWTDYAQAGCAIVAIFVALGLGILQLQLTRRDQRTRTETYLVGALAAVLHAREVLGWAHLSTGKRPVDSLQLTLFGVAAQLRDAEASIAAVPLHLAPSAATARALVLTLHQVRLPKAALEGFFASGATTLQTEYDGYMARVDEAIETLRREYRRLLRRAAPEVLLGEHDQMNA